MKLRTFLILFIIMIAGYHGTMFYKVYWPAYKEARWHASPIYQIEQHFAKRDAIKEKAGQKYLTTFKDKCKEFGGDMKLLKRIENDPNFDQPFKNHLMLKLYISQHALMQQWIHYDILLFPDQYNFGVSLHYYRDFKPRLT